MCYQRHGLARVINCQHMLTSTIIVTRQWKLLLVHYCTNITTYNLCVLLVNPGPTVIGWLHYKYHGLQFVCNLYYICYDSLNIAQIQYVRTVCECVLCIYLNPDVICWLLCKYHHLHCVYSIHSAYICPLCIVQMAYGNKVLCITAHPGPCYNVQV